MSVNVLDRGVRDYRLNQGSIDFSSLILYRSVLKILNFFLFHCFHGRTVLIRFREYLNLPDNHNHTQGEKEKKNLVTRVTKE